MWGCSGPAQSAHVSLHETAEIYLVPKTARARAAITRFDVIGQNDSKAHVVAGNLHIVCGASPPTILIRQRAVKRVRQQLETYEAPEPGVPVVRIIVGDDNLSTEEAQLALQRENTADPFWEVHATLAGGNGDHVAVSGATAVVVPIAVGYSFKDRGMRNDQHDVVALALRARGASQPTVLDAGGTAGSAACKQEPAEEADYESHAEEARQTSKRKLSSPEGSPSPRGDSQPAERGADEAHDEMKQLWEARYDNEYGPKIIGQLSRVLFLKRKPLEKSDGVSQPGKEHEVDEGSTAFASREETRQAILSVLQLRQKFMWSKGVANMRYVLTGNERGEPAKAARFSYETYEEQLHLQTRDEEKGLAKGKTLAAKGKGQRPRERPRERRCAVDRQRRCRQVRPQAEAETLVPTSATRLRHEAAMGGAGLHRPLRS